MGIIYSSRQQKKHDCRPKSKVVLSACVVPFMAIYVLERQLLGVSICKCDITDSILVISFGSVWSRKLSFWLAKWIKHDVVQLTALFYVQLRLRVHHRWRLSAMKIHIRLDLLLQTCPYPETANIAP